MICMSDDMFRVVVGVSPWRSGVVRVMHYTLA
jgi:hypothetical protein